MAFVNYIMYWRPCVVATVESLISHWCQPEVHSAISQTALPQYHIGSELRACACNLAYLDNVVNAKYLVANAEACLLSSK